MWHNNNNNNNNNYNNSNTNVSVYDAVIMTTSTVNNSPGSLNP